MMESLLRLVIINLVLPHDGITLKVSYHYPSAAPMMESLLRLVIIILVLPCDGITLKVSYHYPSAAP